MCCTVSNLISNIFSVFLFIYCCPAVVLYEVLKQRGGLSCTNIIIIGIIVVIIFIVIIQYITIVTIMPYVP